MIALVGTRLSVMSEGVHLTADAVLNIPYKLVDDSLHRDIGIWSVCSGGFD